MKAEQSQHLSRPGKKNAEHILVIGAAGYIGSVVTEELVKEKKRIIAFDNLVQGHKESVSSEAIFIKGDLQDTGLLDQIFQRYPIEAVIHLAALTLVGESMINPELYFQNNLVYGLNLLNIMHKYQIRKLVFSSSCAVYGNPNNVPIDENTPKNPINPYGEAKFAFERILHWYAACHGFSSVSLRYFNAAGASAHFGEHHNPETHLIPNVIKVALGQAKHITVFGSNYPTKDGSCVRDYIHVVDIARAHILALQHLDDMPGCQVYNLGNGNGYSVLDVINTVAKITGTEIPMILSDPRIGDPPILVADSRLVKSKLGWEPLYPSLDAIIESAYRWMKRHPHGYDGSN